MFALIFHDNTYQLQSCPRDQRPSQRRVLRPTPRIDISPSSSDSRCSRQPNSQWTRPSECKFAITSCSRSSVTRGLRDARNELTRFYQIRTKSFSPWEIYKVHCASSLNANKKREVKKTVINEKIDREMIKKK